MDALFTFPNVPSAISPITVYSPSLYAGYFCTSSSAMVKSRRGRAARPRGIRRESYGEERIRRSVRLVRR